eukprot:6197872-Pleurochrysis_carterae.AAC.1
MPTRMPTRMRLGHEHKGAPPPNACLCVRASQYEEEPAEGDEFDELDQFGELPRREFADDVVYNQWGDGAGGEGDDGYGAAEITDADVEAFEDSTTLFGARDGPFNAGASGRRGCGCVGSGHQFGFVCVRASLLACVCA